MEQRHLLAYAILLLIAVAVPLFIIFANQERRERMARRYRSNRRRKERLRERSEQA